MSKTQATIYQSKSAIQNGLAIVDKLCHIGSELGRACHAYCASTTIDMGCQENVVTLKEPADIPQLLESPEYTKQRTTEWFNHRKNAPVSGSTLHNALGLRQLKDQKLHIQLIRGDREPEVISPELQARFDHGTNNEPHAVATFAAAVVPFLYEHSYVFEEGCKFIKDEHDNNLIVVSADGTLRTPDQAVTSVLEIKCPIGGDYKMPVHYTVPKYYVCQLMAEMAVMQVDTCVYICYTAESTTVCEVKFDVDLWETMMFEVKRIYGKLPMQSIILPTRKSEIVTRLNDMIDNFVKENVKFILEVPSRRSADSGTNRIATNDFPYLFPNTPEYPNITYHTVGDVIITINRAESFIREAHMLCRKKASEILAFVLTDTDRLSNQTTPHHLPLAYALKGYSMTGKQMREMSSDVKQACHDHGLRVLCCCYDGQWHNICVRDSENNPLNRLELQKDVWKCSNSMKKAQQVSYIKGLYCEPSDIVVTKEGNTVVVQSQDGHMKKMTTPPMIKSKEVHIIEDVDSHLMDHDIDLDAAGTCNAVADVVLDSPDSHVVESTSMHTEIHLDNCNDAAFEEIADGIDDQLFMCADDLDDTLASLRSSGKKWQQTSSAQLLQLLQNNQIDKFTVKELHIIMEGIKNSKEVTVPQLPYNSDKFTVMKALSRLLGHHTDPIYINKRRKTIRPLKSLCAAALSKKTYPKVALSIAIATYRYERVERKWEQDSLSPMHMVVDGCDTQLKMFSKPEHNAARQRFEPNIIDPSHLLVNNRTRILTKGIQGVNPDAFAKVCDTHPHVINRSLVIDIIDKQNVAFAQRVFSREMEDALRENGDIPEADYVMYVREWYDAIDHPGLSASERVHKLLRLREYLINGVDFCKFPPPGMYIKGLSIVQFCGFIQNVEMRIRMYNLSSHRTFNHRAIGTLAVESFFGDLTEMDPTGCPKAVKIPGMISQVTQLNHYRHDEGNRLVDML